jgi:hypothetical protein
VESPIAKLAAYYSSESVRARVAEYCGEAAPRSGAFDAWGIAGYGGSGRLHEPEGAPVPFPVSRWEKLLGDGADLCRSLADRRGTLIQLDVDYSNPEDTAEPYYHPEACFLRLEPVYEALCDAFARLSLAPIVVMTGRGYHFTFRATLGTPFHDSLVQLGTAEALRSVPLMEAAHRGAGKLLEHLVQEVAFQLKGRTEVPVVVADLPRPEGGPFVCLDLTAYGDPLFQRYSRCAFSGNQKAWMANVAPDRPFVICLPRERYSLYALLEAREDPGCAARLARGLRAVIPDAADGAAWVQAYRASAVARFHEEFDRGPQVGSSLWRYTYEKLDLREVPACVAAPLESPNPDLLMPVHLRTVALALWGMGWHPRSVAGLVRSKYESGRDWGSLWTRYDPASRAEFYVRLFCGAALHGLEDAASFSCRSHALRGLCDRSRCSHDLSRLFERIVERRSQTGRMP